MWTHTHSASGWPRRRLCFHTTSIGAYQDASQPQLWRLGCLQSSDQSLLSKWASDRAGGLCPDQGRSGMWNRVAWFMISKSSWGTMIFYQEGPLGSAGGTCPSYILEIWPQTRGASSCWICWWTCPPTGPARRCTPAWFGAKSRECSWGTYLRHCPRVPPDRIS